MARRAGCGQAGAACPVRLQYPAAVCISTPPLPIPATLPTVPTASSNLHLACTSVRAAALAAVRAARVRDRVVRGARLLRAAVAPRALHVRLPRRLARLPVHRALVQGELPTPPPPNPGLFRPALLAPPTHALVPVAPRHIRYVPPSFFLSRAKANATSGLECSGRGDCENGGALIPSHPPPPPPPRRRHTPAPGSSFLSSSSAAAAAASFAATTTTTSSS